jgi:hypothetical protein
MLVSAVTCVFRRALSAERRIAAVVVSVVYLVLRRVLELMVLRARGDAAKDIELLVLAMSCWCCAAKSPVLVWPQRIKRCWRHCRGRCHVDAGQCSSCAGDATALAVS